MRGNEPKGIWTCSSETHEGPPWQPVVTTLHSIARGAGWIPGQEHEIPHGLTGPQINKTQNHTGAAPCLRPSSPSLILGPRCVQASPAPSAQQCHISALGLSLSTGFSSCVLNGGAFEANNEEKPMRSGVRPRRGACLRVAGAVAL